jgi:GAF domain-containing protein
MAAVTNPDVAAQALEMHRGLIPERDRRRSLAARAVADCAVVHVPDVLEDPEYEARFAATLGFRAALALPMIRDGRAVGAIAVAKPDPVPFSGAQVALLQAFADQAVIAIENVRLFRALEARNRELGESLERQTATAEVLRVISSSPTDLEPAARAIADSAFRLCECAFVGVLRFDGDLVHYLAGRGVTAEAEAALRSFWPRAPEGGSLIGRTVRTRETIHVHDAAPDADYAVSVPVANRAPLGIRTFLGVPLLREGRAVGVIGLSRSEVKPFSPPEIALVQTFADQAVIAIENVGSSMSCRRAMPIFPRRWSSRRPRRRSCASSAARPPRSSPSSTRWCRTRAGSARLRTP